MATRIRKIGSRAFSIGVPGAVQRWTTLLELKHPAALMFAFITVNDPGVTVRVNMDKATPDQFTVQDLINFGLDEPIHGYWYITRQQQGVRYTIVYEPLIPEVFDEYLRIQLQAPVGGAAGEAFFFKWLVAEEMRTPRRSVDDIPYRKATP